MSKLLARQTNKDGSSTLAWKEEKKVCIITGFNPFVYRILLVSKDELVSTLNKIMEKGVDYEGEKRR